MIKIGHEVQFIEVQNMFYDYYYKNALNKIYFRLGISNIYEEINNSVLDQTKNKLYDLIWVFKGMELYPNTLKTLKKRSKKLINFNPDNPFIFSGRGSGNSNVTNSIKLFDEYFTYDLNVKIRLEVEYGINCTLVPFGFDQDLILASDLPNSEEEKSVCFVGNPDKYRAQILLSVLNNGLPLNVFGNNWSRYLKHPLVKCYDAIYEKQFYHMLKKYRVQLNIMRIHNPDSHNMRSIEIPGCGGIMLAPRTTDHVEFFEEGKEAFFYTNTESIVNQAKIILEMDSQKINEIRIAAKEKVLSEFSYSKLVQKFIS